MNTTRAQSRRTSQFGSLQSHFAGDPGVLGRSVKVDDESYTVIGVLPLRLIFLLTRTGKPSPSPSAGCAPQPRLSICVRRLKPNTTLASAQADIDTITRRLAGQYKEDKGQGVLVQSLQASL